MKFQHFMLAAAMVCGLAINTSQAQQATASQRDAYRLQPGDTLDVKYRLTPEYDQTGVTVLTDGNVSLTLLGDVHVAGLTTQQAHDAVMERAALRLRNPDVSLSVKSSVHNNFEVIGEVTTPGRYELRGPISAVEALAIAGGFKTSSSQNNVILIHRLSATSEYGEASKLDFTRLKRVGKTVEMPMMREGDVLFVTSSKTAKIERIVRLANVGLFYSVP